VDSAVSRLTHASLRQPYVTEYCRGLLFILYTADLIDIIEAHSLHPHWVTMDDRGFFVAVSRL